MTLKYLYKSNNNILRYYRTRHQRRTQAKVNLLVKNKPTQMETITPR